MGKKIKAVVDFISVFKEDRFGGCVSKMLKNMIALYLNRIL